MSSTNPALAGLRKSYERAELDESASDADPLRQFDAWLQQAIAAELPEPNAMTLATVAADGRPSTRVVLIKGFDERGIVWPTSIAPFSVVICPIGFERSAEVKAAAERLLKHKVGCLPVLERGALVGIVTTSDLLHAIVGPHAVATDGPHMGSTVPPPAGCAHPAPGG